MEAPASTFYDANKPIDQSFSLSPLFFNSNIKDIHSVSNRIPGGVSTNTLFAASATNTSTITIGRGNRTISHLWMDEDGNGFGGGADDFGIRITETNWFSYSSGASSAWWALGVMSKPIGDFHTTSPGSYNGNRPGNGVLKSWTNHAQNQGLRIRVHGAVIPEPEEYALVFGLFALGFVFFHHRQRMQKPKRKPQATTL